MLWLEVLIWLLQVDEKSQGVAFISIMEFRDYDIPFLPKIRYIKPIP